MRKAIPRRFGPKVRSSGTNRQINGASRQEDFCHYSKFLCREERRRRYFLIKFNKMATQMKCCSRSNVLRFASWSRLAKARSAPWKNSRQKTQDIMTLWEIFWPWQHFECEERHRLAGMSEWIFICISFLKKKQKKTRQAAASDSVQVAHFPLSTGPHCWQVPFCFFFPLFHQITQRLPHQSLHRRQWFNYALSAADD